MGAPKKGEPIILVSYNFIEKPGYKKNLINSYIFSKVNVLVRPSSRIVISV